MVFSLPQFRTTKPVPSLAGRTARSKPLIPITIIGPMGQEPAQVLLDTGADDVVFSIDTAACIGVNLTTASQVRAQGVGGVRSVPILFAPVILLLSDQIETYRWRAVVGFTQAKLRFPLFGIAGGLEHFRTTLDVFNGQIILSPQPTLPTTQDPVP